jgi:hypothetical protein
MGVRNREHRRNDRPGCQPRAPGLGRLLRRRQVVDGFPIHGEIPKVEMATASFLPIRHMDVEGATPAQITVTNHLFQKTTQHLVLWPVPRHQTEKNVQGVMNMFLVAGHGMAEENRYRLAAVYDSSWVAVDLR